MTNFSLSPAAITVIRSATGIRGAAKFLRSQLPDAHTPQQPTKRDISRGVLTWTLTVMDGERVVAALMARTPDELLKGVSSFDAEADLSWIRRIVALELLAVEKGYRRQGLGRALVTEWERLVKLAGVTHIYGQTADAAGFYSQLAYDISPPDVDRLKVEFRLEEFLWGAPDGMQMDIVRNSSDVFFVKELVPSVGFDGADVSFEVDVLAFLNRNGGRR